MTSASTLTLVLGNIGGQIGGIDGEINASVSASNGDGAGTVSGTITAVGNAARMTSVEGCRMSTSHFAQRLPIGSRAR